MIAALRHSPTTLLLHAIRPSERFKQESREPRLPQRNSAYNNAVLCKPFATIPVRDASSKCFRINGEITYEYDSIGVRRNSVRRIVLCCEPRSAATSPDACWTCAAGYRCREDGLHLQCRRGQRTFSRAFQRRP